MSARLRLGISACLAGQSVRYDGAHKRVDALLADFDPHVTWVTVCPEVESGMGAPRPPIRLEGAGGGEVRAIDFTRERADLGPALRAFSARRLADLTALHGFVLKSRSPSCGPGDAPLHAADGRVVSTADGLFAAALRATLPCLPVASEEDLATPWARAAFLARCRERRCASGQSRSKGE